VFSTEPPACSRSYARCSSSASSSLRFPRGATQVPRSSTVECGASRRTRSAHSRSSRHAGHDSHCAVLCHPDRRRIGHCHCPSVTGRLKILLSSLVELLAAVPSVVYGLWACSCSPVVREDRGTRACRHHWWQISLSSPAGGVSLLLAGGVLFVMILPMIVALSRDAIAVVPNEQFEGHSAWVRRSGR